ncbi:MAG: bifunctional folylpolyglutamate synthase/dihydrofolate synthase [Bacteroidetes bacterium]|nr:bifunctional folylpolyglutamate synthase/dihydrofolate synthase [Bacteroidota bacterium]MBU1115644.1 bifunctional folylpolyglutamate synthase/dihydrofolate synthase [Bacteroidota bacterium]MBU1800345.1 bifunctional folylpolyglutamate synthase/dihydrofolate synthase [Bacteroidota bacterium]
MNYEQSLEKLFSLHQFGIKLGLDNIKKLLKHIGNPEAKLKTIHIAGSNGKGSTASFISSILIEAGYKVGLYTSPHFINYTERIRVNGIEIPNEYVAEFVNQNNDFIDAESPTFFELTTAVAFKYFVDQNVDFAVIETGLGGRLDATNVLNSLASVITSISLEHTNILGNDLSTIAKEKAAIIKENQKVFIGSLPDEARDVIIMKAKECNSECFEVKKIVRFSDNESIVERENTKIRISNLPLIGSYQIINASLAVLAIINLFPKIETESILNGLRNVIINSGIQGRYEIYSDNPKVIFDSAHNSEGIELFLEEFKKDKMNYSKCSLIYGAMKDKNVEQILSQLSKYFDVIYGTEIEYERSLKINELINIGNKCGVNIIPLKLPEKFIREFITEKSSEMLVILGSMYILGEIKRNLLSYNT